MTARIALVVGTRPELIKMAPVLLELRKRSGIDALLVATAQHRQMLDQACAAFGITPDIDLDLMRPDQSLTDVTIGILRGMHETFARLKPDAVLVHGDTTTTFATTLAAFYANVRVGHVEAGLRTYDFNAPWPEEMNRRLADPLCEWCFAPTQRAAENLRAERIPETRIFVTGNTAIDALIIGRQRLRAERTPVPELPDDALTGRRLVLVTGHRRESFGDPFRELCFALRDVAELHPDVAVVYPVHLNPNVQRPVRDILGSVERVYLIPPLAYLPFVSLLERSTLIVTDSGGIQEEAPTLKKPVLIMRRTTERPEAVELGLSRLVGTSRRVIVEEASRLLTDSAAYSEMIADVNPYGDGRAAERIANVLEAGLG
jgi:UDP-N-acetylglucosamine 2-epimerase (non-hydrolysing)